MEVILVDDKKFVKASSIARDLGYTTDYVGQLCRSGKVDAQVVGRNWYVNEDSIKAHKKGRYRSTKRTTQKTLKKTVSSTANSTKFEQRLAAYEPDDADLIPATRHVSVATEEVTESPVEITAPEPVKRVAVTREPTKQTVYKAAERPVPIFKGKIAVEEHEDVSEAVSEPEQIFETEAAEDDPKAVLEEPVEHRPRKESPGSETLRQPAIHDVPVTDLDSPIASVTLADLGAVTETVSPYPLWVVVVLILSFSLALTTSVFLITLEQVVTYGPTNQPLVSYNLDLNTISEIISDFSF